MLDPQHLCILETVSSTRHTGPYEGLSVPGLSVCTPDLASILSWRIHSTAFGGDHFPIIISFPSLPHTSISSPSSRMKYHLPSDWSVFSQQVQSKISSLPIVCRGNEALCPDRLSKIMLEVADNIFPIKKNRSNKIPLPPWWDNQCTATDKKRKEAERNITIA